MRCILLCCFWDSAAPAPVKPAEPKKAITITFTGSKPRPKLFVGAAFFSTGKKPTSMKKRKSTPRSSGQKPAPAKSKAATVAPLKAGAKRPQQGAVAPGPTPSTKSLQRTVAEAVRAG